jgi:vacuolar protein sorting-associated protein 13A/C
MCIDGVLPALTIVVCFAHFQKILGVASAWSLVLAQIKSDNVAANGTDGEGLQIIEEERSTFQVIKYSGSGAFGSTKEPTMLDSVSKKEREGISTVSDTQHEFFEHIHASIALRRLSAKLFTGSLKGTDRLEAHLVSVVLTTSMSTDGSSLSRLCGGWFWILDLMPASFPRRQRLIAHSSLPMQSETFSYSEKYEMMEELERQGVFQDGYEGSSELADIEIRISPNSLNVSKCTGPSRDLIIHARFSSLFINWNPYVIKALILTKQYMLESTLSSIKRNPEAFNVLLSTLHLSEKPSTTPHRGQSKNTIMSHKPNHSMVRLDARMDKFVISFHSAKDDLQLYILTMSGAKIDVSILPNSDSVTAFLEVGDFRMETPQLGRTLPLYRTLMGLAPNQSTCLLSVKYFQGIPAVASSGIIGADATVHESCAQISVSPMRFVHIQAQIVTLVDYIQDGVIGAVLGTTSPAVAPATVPKVTQAVTGEKLFLVHATSFEFVVPHAAYIKDYFSFHALELDVRYRSLANFGGGEAEVVLSEMSCACSRGISMLKEPVKISLHASIAPNHAPTEEDRAIKVSMDLSEACLFLTHNQFEQLLYMTKRNMTEENNFLRDQPAGSQDIKNEGNNSSLGRNTTKSGSTWDSNTLNHAGVQALIIKKRILIKTKVQVLALVLCRHSADEPFLEIAGVKSDINLNLLPDQSKIQLGFILHNLNVEDKRIETEHRYYRQVFSHLKIREGTKDVFNLKYLKDEANGLANIDVCVGDLQLIVIPDCMYELMDFMQISDVVSLDIERSLGENKCLDTITNVAIDINDSNEEIEAMVEKRPSEPKTVQTSLSIQTSTCRIVMVNMESSSTETLVAQGKVDIQISSKKLLISGLILSNETQVNGESLEIYTSQLDDIGSSVQIMEPASFSVSVSKTYSPGIGTQDLVIKAAALSSVDISFSMKNAGLLQDVIKSIKESLIFAQQMQEQRSLSDKAYSHDPKPLTDVEFDRIENLAFALEHVEGVKSTLIKDSFGNYSDSSRASDSFSELTGIKDDCSQERILHYYRINVTVPDVSFTLINDLQGLDAPLLKLSARNMVGSGQSEMLSNSSQFVNGVKAYGAFEWSSVKFRVRINANVAAEYFDVISNNWEKLLLKPWESTLTLQRGETHRFKRAVKRMATDVDIESQTCLVSFSEQFLVSVGTALRMWSFEHYTRKMLVEETFDLKQNMKDERICMSPSVPSPYCIDNQIGIPVYYVVQPCGTTTGNLDKRQRCDSGSLQYFRFQYPPAKGVGGRRLYGQEGSEFKGLDLYIGDSVLRFPHIDTEINNLRRAHVFSDSLMIFIDVVNGGRATVSYSLLSYPSLSSVSR